MLCKDICFFEKIKRQVEIFSYNGFVLNFKLGNIQMFVIESLSKNC